MRSLLPSIAIHSDAKRCIAIHGDANNNHPLTPTTHQHLYAQAGILTYLKKSPSGSKAKVIRTMNKVNAITVVKEVNPKWGFNTEVG